MILIDGQITANKAIDRDGLLNWIKSNRTTLVSPFMDSYQNK